MCGAWPYRPSLRSPESFLPVNLTSQLAPTKEAGLSLTPTPTLTPMPNQIRNNHHLRMRCRECLENGITVHNVVALLCRAHVTGNEVRSDTHGSSA